jgi:pimeloyl-ACP methyl ester carboxylesterase
MGPLLATRRARWLGRLVLYGGFLLVGLPVAFSQVLVATVRQPVSAAPPGFEQAVLASEGLRLRAWILRGSGDRAAVVVVHGLGDSLESYVESARVLARRGHSGLLLDLRGHGGSEGTRTTLGGREREDVRAGLAALAARGLSERGTILMGTSMGAVSALRAAAGDDRVRAVVAEAPFDTYRDSVAHHAKLLYGLPPWLPIIPLSIAVAEWRAGFRADDVDAVDAARRLHAPLLAIVDGADPRMPDAVVRRVYDAHPGPKRLWTAPGAPHAGASLAPGYWREVTAFLEDNGL